MQGSQGDVLRGSVNFDELLVADYIFAVASAIGVLNVTFSACRGLAAKLRNTAHPNIL